MRLSPRPYHPLTTRASQRASHWLHHRAVITGLCLTGLCLLTLSLPLDGRPASADAASGAAAARLSAPPAPSASPVHPAQSEAASAAQDVRGLVAVTARQRIHSATPRTRSAPANTAGVLGAGFCAGVRVTWPSSIHQWSVPAGCYSRIYAPSPARYVSRPSFGWCNWWPEVLHPWLSAYTALHLPSHSSPRVGATVFFAGGVQGAGSAGHYAEVVAIAPGGSWALITEMNFAWRGGGFARVDYRYIHVGAGVSFRY